MIIRMKKNKINFSKVTLLVFFFSVLTFIIPGNNGNAAVIFQADFESDTVGGPPTASTGNILLQNVTGSSYISVQAADSGLGFPTKYVRIHREYFGSPRFLAVPVGVDIYTPLSPYNIGAYTVTWKAYAFQEPSSAGGIATIGGDPFSGGPALTATFWNNNINYAYGGGNDWISYDPNIPYTFKAVVNLDSDKVDLYIDGVKKVDQKDFQNSSFNELYRFIFSFGGQASEDFALDDIIIENEAMPSDTTSPADNLTANTATLNGTVNPNGLSTTYYFEYGTDTNYGSSTTVTNAGSGTAALSMNASISGLTPNTLYHYRVVATNFMGTSYGEDQTFTTLAVVVDADNDGIPDASDSCPNTFDSGKDSDGDGVDDACDNCRYDANPGQEDSDTDLLGDACDDPNPGSGIDNVITLPAPTFYPGAPFWVTAEIQNKTSQAIQTLRPDCYNTYWVLPGAKNLCKRGPAYGIPTDIVTIPAGGSFLVTCDINEMFESFPSSGSYTLTAIYENLIQDPAFDPSNASACTETADPECYPLWIGAVASGEKTIVLDTTSTYGVLTLQADRHDVESGTKPVSAKFPIVDMETRVFDKSSGSCAAGYGISWQHYQEIWEKCGAVAGIRTNNKGKAMFGLPPGDYLVIGHYNPETDNIYIGNSVGEIVTGGEVYKYLQVIKKSDGKKVPGKYRKFTGSELLVIEPEYVEWSSEAELYPFIFDSVGDWTVTTSVTPPEGFVADNTSLSAEVTNEVESVQFTITDIGSRWVRTKVQHKIKHKKQKEIIVESDVGIKLTPELAQEKGLSIYGDDQGEDDNYQGQGPSKGKKK